MLYTNRRDAVADEEAQINTIAGNIVLSSAAADVYAQWLLKLVKDGGIKRHMRRAATRAAEVSWQIRGAPASIAVVKA